MGGKCAWWFQCTHPTHAAAAHARAPTASHAHMSTGGTAHTWRLPNTLLCQLRRSCILCHSLLSPRGLAREKAGRKIGKTWPVARTGHTPGAGASGAGTLRGSPTTPARSGSPVPPSLPGTRAEMAAGPMHELGCQLDAAKLEEAFRVEETAAARMFAASQALKLKKAQAELHLTLGEVTRQKRLCSRAEESNARLRARVEELEHQLSGTATPREQAAAACNGAAGLTPEASQALIVSLHNSYRKTMASEARLGQAEMELEEARQAAERAQEVAEREALATPRLEKRVSRLTYELNEARVRIAELTSAREKNDAALQVGEGDFAESRRCEELRRQLHESERTRMAAEAHSIQIKAELVRAKHRISCLESELGGESEQFRARCDAVVAERLEQLKHASRVREADLEERMIQLHRRLLHAEHLNQRRANGLCQKCGHWTEISQPNSPTDCAPSALILSPESLPSSSVTRVAQGGKKGTHSSSRSLSESGREEWFSSDLADHHMKPENRVLEMNGDRPSTPRSLHETTSAHTNLPLNTRESLKAARYLDAREENTNSELSSDKNYRTNIARGPKTPTTKFSRRAVLDNQAAQRNQKSQEVPQVRPPVPGGSPTRIDLAKQQLSSHGLHLSGEAKRERSSTPKVLHTPPHIHQSSIAGTAAHIPAIHPTNSPMKAGSPIEIEHRMSGTSTHGTRPSLTLKDDLVLPPPTNYYRLSPPPSRANGSEERTELAKWGSMRGLSGTENGSDINMLHRGPRSELEEPEQQSGHCLSVSVSSATDTHESDVMDPDQWGTSLTLSRDGSETGDEYESEVQRLRNEMALKDAWLERLASALGNPSDTSLRLAA